MFAYFLGLPLYSWHVKCKKRFLDEWNWNNLIIIASNRYILQHFAKKRTINIATAFFILSPKSYFLRQSQTSSHATTPYVRLLTWIEFYSTFICFDSSDIFSFPSEKKNNGTKTQSTNFVFKNNALDQSVLNFYQNEYRNRF